jgi:hypothetical protein
VVPWQQCLMHSGQQYTTLYFVRFLGLRGSDLGGRERDWGDFVPRLLYFSSAGRVQKPQQNSLVKSNIGVFWRLDYVGVDFWNGRGNLTHHEYRHASIYVLPYVMKCLLQVDMILVEAVIVSNRLIFSSTSVREWSTYVICLCIHCMKLYYY